MGFAIVVAKSSMETVLAKVVVCSPTLAAVLAAVEIELPAMEPVLRLMAAVFVSVETSMTGTPPPRGSIGRKAGAGRIAHPTTGTIRIPAKILPFLLTDCCPLYFNAVV
jgi:hypothetical protein